MREFTTPLEKVVKEFSLEPLHYTEEQKKSAMIRKTEVSRPGLNLCGYFKHFEQERIQILGNNEMCYLEELSAEKRKESMEAFFSHNPRATIVSSNLPVTAEMIAAAEQYDAPLFRTTMTASELVAELIGFLNVELAPRITRHGVLVEVYGEGVLLMGESGVGKSETAVELIKRGHRLIADDAVEIKKVSNRTLVGSSPDNIRHFLEMRGIGIVNARRIFGMGAVKMTEKIDMVVQLELWDSKKVYDRLGMENEEIEILGNSVPCLTIPVKPGRNLAIIIEVAAMNNRQKKMGYNAAEELLAKLGLDSGTGNNLSPDAWDVF